MTNTFPPEENTNNTIFIEMTLQKIGYILASGLFATVLACGESNTAPKSEAKDPEPMQITIRRLTNSQIPLEADSAFVRVWNTKRALNQVQAIRLPQPGTERTVTIELPVDTGYSIGLLAFKREGNNYSLYASGETHNIVVRSAQTNTVNLTVEPWEIVFDVPDTIRSGRSTTLKATITRGPSFFSWTAWFYGMDKSIETVADHLEFGSDKSSVLTFTPPIVDADTAMYFQVDFDVLAPTDWTPPGRTGTLVVHYPFRIAAWEPLRIPMKAATGDVVVAFDKRRTNSRP